MALIIKVVNSPGGHLYTTGDGLEQLGGWSTEKAMELTQKPVSTQYESKIMDLGLDGRRAVNIQLS
ncbi:hypothetical protein SARC_10810 [Sphaeroforma arctica JP610]|uniref:Uncharacterized protein n=1 Tax=Sphaeroforma arctica JP610 TaxID=667725 RepID=A0A0L0FIV2_9EUKA|nr:hypothetical protein SARC_10810 [Sphaeroforma arctica JP610]KNC76704.1 hypothetical protein SARC_10810 [Sphaeroforma arctica JP610]|eukprot:XP_014150606.1 hypothetical protein SARC_10810 [Sphaeroforma arctica JP610]